FVKLLFGVVKLIIDFLLALTRNAIDEAINLISNFFPELRGYIDSGTINIAILILAAVVGTEVIIDKNFRNTLEKPVEWIIRALQPKIEALIDWLNNFIYLLLRCSIALLPDAATVIVSLISNIASVISHLKSLAAQSVFQS